MSLSLSPQYKRCIQTNTAVNNSGADKSARCNWVLILTELVVSGTQCTSFVCITNHLRNTQFRWVWTVMFALYLLFIL